MKAMLNLVLALAVVVGFTFGTVGCNKPKTESSTKTETKTPEGTKTTETKTTETKEEKK